MHSLTHATAACSTIELSRNMFLKEQGDSRMLRADIEDGGSKSRPVFWDGTLPFYPDVLYRGELSRNVYLKEQRESRMLIPSQSYCDGRNPAVLLRDSTILPRCFVSG
jgi:hypothetical protein